jgi:8-oxo-dGTP diphosphatase
LDGVGPRDQRPAHGSTLEQAGRVTRLSLEVTGHRVLEMTERFRVVPAAYVFLRSSRGVLLQLRSNTGYMDDHWAAAAAGHVESAESVFQSAVREAREELGIEIRSADLTPLCAMHRTHGNGRPVDERVDFFFSCLRWSGEPRLLEADKAAALRWFPLDALPEPVVPHERVVLDCLAGGPVPQVLTYGFG